MYIEPNSTLQLYKNMVLNKDYSNTLWFSSLSAQNTFFGAQNRIAYEITKMSYQRKSRGVLKIELNIGQIYDVNYMRFKNDMFDTPYSTKWFYAFVDSVEYVSNTACYVNFTIDVIQTYMFDWTLNECLIERQHSVTDVAGDNLEIEGLELGDYINYESPDTTFVFKNDDGNYPAGSVNKCAIVNYSVIVAIAYGTPWTPIPPYTLFTDSDVITSGLPTGISYLVFDYDHFEEFIGQIYQMGQYTDSIVSITVMPSDYVPSATILEDDETGDEYVIYGNSKPSCVTHSVNIPTALDGYTPMNKKLLTYPYCYMEVYNDQNETLELRYELSEITNQIDFAAYGIMGSTPEIVLTVNNYDKGEFLRQIPNPKYILSVSGFPQVSYSNDAYKAWFAMNYDQRELTRDIAGQELDIATRMNALQKYQNLGNATIGTLSGIGNAAIGGLVTGNPTQLFNGVTNAASSAFNGYVNNQKLNINQESNELDNYKTIQGLNADESRARKLPNTPHAGSTSSSVAIGIKGFFIQKKNIRAIFAEKVDKYFNMFGYAMNKVGVPNIHARSRYTYIKTNSSNITGNIPADDKEVLNTIFNRGIRFWDSSDYSHYGVYPSYSAGVVQNANTII